MSPRYIVKERRARDVEYLIEAESTQAAGYLDGEILEEAGDADDYGYELLSVTEVAADTEALSLPRLDALSAPERPDDGRD